MQVLITAKLHRVVHQKMQKCHEKLMYNTILIYILYIPITPPNQEQRFSNSFLHV